MDYGLIAGLEPTGKAPADTGVPPFEFYEAARWAMGDTRRFAERVELVDMVPRQDIASTGYALVNPGSEYLVLEPHGDGRVLAIDVLPGSYRVEWFDVTARESVTAAPLVVEAAGVAEMESPFPSHPAVVHLRRIGAGR
ncbi:hypothetical protein ACFQ9X_37930 [Catenulispora yoronensis]